MKNHMKEDTDVRHTKILWFSSPPVIFGGGRHSLPTIRPKCVSSMLKNATQKMAGGLKCNSCDTNLQPLCLVPESPKLLSTRLPLESWRETRCGWKNISSKEKATWQADIKQNNPNFCGTCARSTLKEKLAQGGLRPFEWVFFTTFLSKKPFPFLLVSIFRTSWGMASNSGSCHDWSHRNVASTWNLEEMLGALHLAKLSSWWIQKNTLYWTCRTIWKIPICLFLYKILL